MPARGIAGRLDDHLDALVATGIAPAFGKTRARDAGGVPADAAARRLGALRIEVRDHRDVEAGDRRHLRQKHRAEFSRADEPDADRLTGRNARGEEGLQIHVSLAVPSPWYARRAASLCRMAGAGGIVPAVSPV